MDNPTEQISALSIQLGGLDAELDVAKRKLKDLQTQVDANKDSEESELSELNDCVRQLAHSSRKLHNLEARQAALSEQGAQLAAKGAQEQVCGY